MTYNPDAIIAEAGDVLYCWTSVEELPEEDAFTEWLEANCLVPNDNFGRGDVVSFLEFGCSKVWLDENNSVAVEIPPEVSRINVAEIGARMWALDLAGDMGNGELEDGTIWLQGTMD